MLKLIDKKVMLCDLFLFSSPSRIVVRQERRGDKKGGRGVT